MIAQLAPFRPRWRPPIRDTEAVKQDQPASHDAPVSRAAVSLVPALDFPEKWAENDLESHATGTERMADETC